MTSLFHLKLVFFLCIQLQSFAQNREHIHSSRHLSSNKAPRAKGLDIKKNASIIVKETIPVTPLHLSKRFKGLYKKLIQATEKRAPWKHVKIKLGHEISDWNEFASVLYRLVFHVVDEGKAYYIKRYRSLGRNLPLGMDLYGFCKANGIAESNWTRVETTVSTMIQHTKAKSASEVVYDAESLWMMMGAFKNISFWEKKKITGTWDEWSAQSQEAYLFSVRSYFRGSCELAWGLSLDVVQQIEVTQVAGTHVNGTLRGTKKHPQPKAWYIPLVSTNQQKRKLSEYASILMELALLKHADIATINAAGSPELLGTIIDPYLDDMQRALTQANVALDRTYQQFFLSKTSDLSQFIKVATKYCRPNLLLRFCTIVPIMYQLGTYTSEKRASLRPNSIPHLTSQFTNMERSHFLQLLQNNYHTQQIAAKINTLTKEITEITTSQTQKLTQLQQDQTYDREVVATQSTLTQLQRIADSFRDNDAAEVPSYDTSFNATVSSIDKILKGANTALTMYLPQIQSIGQAAYTASSSRSKGSGMALSLRMISIMVAPKLWTKSSTYADLVRTLDSLRKDFMNPQHITSYMYTFNSQTQTRFKKLIDSIQKEMPQIRNLRKAMLPLWNKPNISQEEILRYGQEYLIAYANYTHTITLAEVNEVQQLFVVFATEACRIASEKDLATLDCRHVTRLSNVFTKLGRAVSMENDAVDALASLVQSAFKAASSRFFVSAIDIISKGTLTHISDADAQRNDANIRDFREMRKEVDKMAYIHALSLVHMTISAAQLQSTVLLTCHFHTYLNGGVVIPPCVSVLVDPKGEFGLELLLAYSAENTPEPSERIAYIPTSPSFPGDKHFITLEQLSSPNGILFAIPSNETWLKQNHWLPSDKRLSNTVIFVKKFAPILPPFNLFSKANAHVEIHTKTSTVTDLGPALHHQKFSIPSRTFRFQYHSKTSRNIRDAVPIDCKRPIENMYQQCDPRAPQICGESEGAIEDDGPLPSLFGPFMLSIQTTGQADQATLAKIRASAPLAVFTELLYHNVKESKYESRKLTLRKICCSDGFLADWESMRCKKCPRGSISKFGGTLCLKSGATSRAH
uniref:AlNc14C262G9827 protein n=1 Tax=Albugo laibachii Nc14 TaxID=890382 RepID=F0WU04_9STRA|nr:AlNc14C262G9827 [Albugo laibachii Nc14]|eukprot:CCA24848.1 AlNc14C262G9827 [Albugo laibachii Nc14]